MLDDIYKRGNVLLQYCVKLNRIAAKHYTANRNLNDTFYFTFY